MNQIDRRSLLAGGIAAMLAAVAPTAAHAEHLFVIDNGSADDMRGFYAHNSYADDNAVNLLGEHGLAARATQTLDLEDGSGYCLFDIRAVFANGGELADGNVDVCDTAGFRYDIVGQTMLGEPIAKPADPAAVLPPQESTKPDK